MCISGNKILCPMAITSLTCKIRFLKVCISMNLYVIGNSHVLSQNIHGLKKLFNNDFKGNLCSLRNICKNNI